MRVTFRVDASGKIGNGHVYRCLSLAEGLLQKSVEVNFICREHEGNLNDLIKNKSFPVTSLIKPEKKSKTNTYADWLGVSQEDDAEETISVLQDDITDYLVLDHYALGIEWENRVKAMVNNIVIVDDLADSEHNCDVVINQSYFSIKEDYKYLVPSHCKFLLGSEYILLSKPYEEYRSKLHERDNVLKRILVFFTAGDDNGETIKALEGIALAFDSVHVDVVVGESNRYKDEINDKCEQHGWKFHCQIDYMHELISKADVAIGSAGANSWERCALGVPALVTLMADNQQANANALEKMGAAICIGEYSKTSADDYRKALLAFNKDRLQSMSASALKLVDGKGVDRVCDYLLSALNI